MRIKPVSGWILKSTVDFKWGRQGARVDYTTHGREMLIDIKVLDKIQKKQYSIRQVAGEIVILNEYGIEVEKLTGKPTIKIEEALVASGMVESKEIIEIVDILYKGIGEVSEYEKTDTSMLEEGSIFECRHGKWQGYRLGAEIYVILGFAEIPISYTKSLEIRYIGEVI